MGDNISVIDNTVCMSTLSLSSNSVNSLSNFIINLLIDLTSVSLKESRHKCLYIFMVIDWNSSNLLLPTQNREKPSRLSPVDKKIDLYCPLLKILVLKCREKNLNYFFFQNLLQ